jgi:hypothetical protein
MQTLKADSKQRVRLPGIKAGQVLSCNPNADGSILLVPVKEERKPAFPRGSLLKYLTPERDKEQLVILSACVQAPLCREIC